MTCGGSFPPDRFAPLPAAAIASSTASRGPEEASPPSETQSVSRPPAATTPFCVIRRDHAGQQAEHHATTRPGTKDQLTLSGIASKPVSALLSDLAILKSHSRPKVSNDNPYSEAQFKTLKYCPAFPGTFGSLQDARAFCGVFFTYYNHEHRHSGIGLHTPYSVHIGTAAAIQDKRQAVLNAACAANPRRFTRRPKAPALPVTAWINKPVTDSDITQHPSQEAA